EPTDAVFWPQAGNDLTEYVFFPKGKDDRFWSYGFGAILGSVLATSDTDEGARSPARKDTVETGGAAAAEEAGPASAPAGRPPRGAGSRCSSGTPPDSADRWIARIPQAIGPSESQGDVI